MGCCDKTTDKAMAKRNESIRATNPSADVCCASSSRLDYLLWGGLLLVGSFYFLHLIGASVHVHQLHMSIAVFQLMNTMFWGMLVGIVMVACLSRVPREFVIALLGRRNGLIGMYRATLAGLCLDLCSHGILMVGAKLYERGASTGQVMAFLIASPWNSLSLTIILVALIGLSWTLVFICLSAIIAMITGLLFDALIHRGVLPDNPNRCDLPDDFLFWPAAKQGLMNLKFSIRGTGNFLLLGVVESRVVIRWLLVGVILASLIRTFIPDDYFGDYFGPTALGLGVTLLVATVIEVCSEGSTPIAADIFNRAGAPGNAFAFLMTGVSTDYTEIMVLKDRTRSWRIALFLPLLTLPQIVVIAFALNVF